MDRHPRQRPAVYSVDHYRPIRLERRWRYNEPPPGLYVPGGDHRAGARVRQAHHLDADAARVPPPGHRRRSEDTARVLRAGIRRRRVRNRHRDRAAKDSHRTRVPLPRRAGPASARRSTTSAMSSSRRGCRSSSGAASRTTSCSTWRRAGRCATRRSSSSRCGGCWPTSVRRRSSTTSAASGSTCAISPRLCPDAGCFRPSTTICGRRSGVRPSCFSTASSARTGACSTC